MVSGHRALLPREVPPTEAYMRQVSVFGMDSVGRCGEVVTAPGRDGAAQHLVVGQ